MLICHYCTYQFEVIPFGLINFWFNILDKMSSVKCYIDDVTRHSKTEYDHILHIETLMKLPKNLKKCHFMQPRVELLGHDVYKDGVNVDEVKVEIIRNEPWH